MKNLTVHITDRCDMGCSFCVQKKEPKHEEGPVIESLQEALRSGEFKHVVITGGEPLLDQEGCLRSLRLH